MKPYYEDAKAGIVIYHGDCREVLPELEPVDLVLTDPPYGISVGDRSDGGIASRKGGSRDWGRTTWDRERPEDSTMQAVVAAGLNAIVWGGNYFNLGASPCWLIWDKKQRDFTFSDGELAWTNLQKAVRIFSYSRRAVTIEGRVHPTQKPLPLMKWCIRQAGIEGAILDPFMGSGTTLRAAKDLGRKAIGIEIEERYCEIAVNRLRQEVLF